jgi:hypothetical protein
LTGKGSGKRGRPLGYRLSEASRRAISQSKTGQKHKQETKDKISRSLVSYFRAKNPLSEEMSACYYRFDNTGALADWIDEYSEDIDSAMDVMTEKVLRNKGKIEISCGHNIEFFSHGITPELIYLFKEHCEITGADFEQVLEEAGIL